MLLDGLAFSNMMVFLEALQLDKICINKLGIPEEKCNNLTHYKNETDETQKHAVIFQSIDSFALNFIPLFFILFMGAWSDKYGRKVPLWASILGHCFLSGGYFLNTIHFHWRVEYLLIASFLDSFGGGAVSFLTAANSYISDVTTEQSRTSRIGLANSIWFLGGPVGTLVGRQIFSVGGYKAIFGTSFTLYTIALLYIIFLLPESHGPFADKKHLKKVLAPKPTLRLRDSVIRIYGLSRKAKNPLGRSESEAERNLKKITTWKMVRDFFDPRRLIDSLKSVFKKREGNTRMYILLLILANLLRKIGRGALLYKFTIVSLGWNTQDFLYWDAYKKFVTTMGSMFAVPLLSVTLGLSDVLLAVVGAVSSVSDYLIYGFVHAQASALIWIAPLAALLVNSAAIAIRALLSKYVTLEELGKVSGVLGALDGVMPMVSTPLYSAVYHATLETHPGAQFFAGVGVNVLMALIFFFIILTDRTRTYDVEAYQGPKPPKGPVQEKSFVERQGSDWLKQENERPNHLGVGTLLLSVLNFSITIPVLDRDLSIWSQHERDTRVRQKLASVAEEFEPTRKTSVESAASNATDSTTPEEGEHSPSDSPKGGVDNRAFAAEEID